MAHSLASDRRSTEGNIVSNGFQKDDAVRCWQASIAAVDDKVLAAECGMSRGYFSKVSSGQQGDLFDLAARLPAHRASIRADFFGRLAELERVNPLDLAAEQLTAAATRWLRLRSEFPLRMAKADLGDRREKQSA